MEISLKDGTVQDVRSRIHSGFATLLKFEESDVHDSQHRDEQSPIQKYGVLLLIMGLGGLCAVTFPIWIGNSDLPAIPWLFVLCPVPREVDLVFLVLTIVSLLLALRLKTKTSFATAIATFTWGGLLLLDQQRVQTWAWQFWLLLFVYTFSKEADLPAIWRWLVIAVYFWSAFSKLDRGFIDGHGQLLLEGFLNGIGQTTKFWSPTARQGTALLMPLSELSIALLLMSSHTRRFGWVGSIAMHIGLLLTLGMNGLGHEWGVLGWNIWFLAQNSLLWASESTPQHSISVIGKFLATLLFAYPALQFVDRCDHWPAWEVYCARPKLVRVLILPQQVDALPQSLRRFVQPPEPLQELQAVRIEGWGFEQLRSPLNPQERYRLALISSLLANSPDGSWQIQIASSPKRLTGEREYVTLSTRAELNKHLEKFLVNMQPRLDHQKK